jgi:hypothetical protein
MGQWTRDPSTDAVRPGCYPTHLEGPRGAGGVWRRQGLSGTLPIVVSALCQHIHTLTRAHARALIHTPMHMLVRAHARTRTYTHIHARARTRAHAYVHLYAHTRVHLYIHSYTCSCAHTRTHTHSHAHTRVHMYMYAHMRTHMCVPCCLYGLLWLTTVARRRNGANVSTKGAIEYARMACYVVITAL